MIGTESWKSLHALRLCFSCVVNGLSTIEYEREEKASRLESRRGKLIMGWQSVAKEIVGLHSKLFT